MKTLMRCNPFPFHAQLSPRNLSKSKILHAQLLVQPKCLTCSIQSFTHSAHSFSPSLSGLSSLPLAFMPRLCHFHMLKPDFPYFHMLKQDFHAQNAAKHSPEAVPKSGSGTRLVSEPVCLKPLFPGKNQVNPVQKPKIKQDFAIFSLFAVPATKSAFFSFLSQLAPSSVLCLPRNPCCLPGKSAIFFPS